MSRKKISTTVYLDEDQLIALKAMTVRSGAPMAFMIRVALNEFIARQISSGHLDADAVAGMSIRPDAMTNTRGSRSSRESLDEATVERVLRRLLAEKGSDA